MSSRSRKLSPPAWDALAEALATFEWYKRPFESLVRRLFSDAPSVLARLNFADPKRKVAWELAEGLRLRESEFQGLVVDALVELSQVDSDFPHLARLEDGSDRVEEARTAQERVLKVTAAHSDLADARDRLRQDFEDQAALDEARRADEALLLELHEEFLAMHASPDRQARGRAFELLLNRLFALWDLTPRASYSLAHEQIDGAFTFRTDDYLLEARWWKEPLQSKELNDFRMKVDGKARNTLGLCIAISGFTDGAVELHSKAQSPLILMDGRDLMLVLEGRIGLDELLERKRRHAAETGNVLFRVSN